MVLLDEALAAVAGSEVDDFCVLEEIFCQLFSACEHAHDVARADQWIRIGEAIAERRKLPAVSAFCRTHYGGVLTAAGRWPEADAALTEAVRLWGLGQRSLRGGALVRLADLRVRQGRFEEAEQLLDGLDADVDAARPLAAIHLAEGETRRSPATSSSARSTRSTRRARRPRRCWRCSSTSTSPADLLDEAEAAAERLRDAARPRHAEPLPRGRRRAARGRVVSRDGHRRPAGVPARGARRLRAGADADGAGPLPARARQRAAHRPPRGGDGRGAGRARGVRAAAGGPPRRRRRRGAAVARRPDGVGPRRAAGC